MCSTYTRLNVVLILTVLVFPVPVLVREAIASERDARVARACAFLDSLHDQAVHLVRETSSNHTYWIASDNLLAQQALKECGSSNAQSIQAILYNATCCQQGNDHMHESLLGRSIPLSIHDKTVSTVTGYWKSLTNSQETGNHTVKWEYHNSTGTLSPYDYGDIATYTLLEYKRRNNETGVQDMIQTLNTMWTGTGIADEPYKESGVQSGIYQTYKTALYAYSLTQQSIPVPSTVTSALLRMQGPDGGFHTGYANNMTYAGTDENAETTSIAIIALSPTLVPPSSPPALIAVTASIALLLLLIVLRIVLRRQSKQSSAPSSRKIARQGLERRLLQSKLPDGRQY